MKKSIIHKSIFLKIIVTGVCIGIVFVSIVSFYLSRASGAVFFENTVRFLEEEIQNEQNRLSIQVEEIRNLQFVIASSPNMQVLIESDFTEENTQAVEEVFVNQIEAFSVYDQLRVLDLSGKEVIRVDESDDGPQITAKSELQDKSNRDYFIAASALPNKSVYIAPPSLNREGMPPQVEIPLTPVTQYVLPLTRSSGERVGYLVANVLLDQVFDREAVIENSEYELVIFNLDGELVLSQNRDDEWGGEKNLNNGNTLNKIFPEIELSDFLDEKGNFTRGGNLYAYQAFTFGTTDNQWVFLNVISTDALYAPLRAELQKGIGFFFGTFVIIITIFGICTKWYLSPLERMAKSIRRVVQSDGKYTLNVHSSDEIGVVTKSVNDLLMKLHVTSTDLEAQVTAKTEKLNDKLEELKLSQRALANVLEDIATEKEKAETILSSIDDGVIVVDQNREVALVNIAATKILGIGMEGIIGRAFREVISFCNEAGNPLAQDFISMVLDSHTSLQQYRNIFLQKDNGVIPLSVSFAPLIGVDGSVFGVVIAFQDRSLAYEIDKAKSEFVSIAAHQLKTPVGAIRWNTEMLLSGDYGKLTDDQIEVIQNIFQLNIRMNELVHSFLNISRIELGTFEIAPKSTDIVSVCEEVLVELEEKIKAKSLHIKKDFQDGLPEYSMDSNLLRIIFQNLISNAIKYGFEESEVTVCIQVKEEIVLSVSNEGIGIEPEKAEKIFQKFYRTDSAQKIDPNGNGLGLYILQSIAKNAGGRISFVSEPNKVTTFTVTFPLTGMRRKDGSKRLDHF